MSHSLLEKVKMGRCDALRRVRQKPQALSVEAGADIENVFKFADFEYVDFPARSLRTFRTKLIPQPQTANFVAIPLSFCTLQKVSEPSQPASPSATLSFLLPLGATRWPE